MQHDLSKAPSHLEFKVDKGQAGSRLDLFLREKLPWRSRTGIQQLIESGKILRQLPGKREASEAKRPAGRLVSQEIVYFLVPQRIESELLDSPPPAELQIVYEDRYIVAVNKPPGIAVHPSARYREHTLISLLHSRYKKHQDPSRDMLPKLCHRIDRETSGLVLAAKDDLVRSHLGKIFEGRKVQKEYLAIVEGEVRDDKGSIDFSLAPARDSQVQIRMEARRDGKGFPCFTEYEVLRRYDGYTFLAARPKTGRQHQIRVHLAAIGHPIIGDKIYGPDENLFLKALESDLRAEDKELLKLDRHALHAHRLRFEHPALKQEIELVAPLTEDLENFLRTI